MSDANRTESTGTAQATADHHLELAAFHLHEASRQHLPDLPSWESDHAARMDARYRAMGAHRRSIESCRFVAVERVAAALALLDGEPWPACTRALSPLLPPAHRAATAAQRRQRYRHEARIIVAEVCGYYEVKTEDTEDLRQLVIIDARRQRTDDAGVVATWRERVNLPTSTVMQLYKDGE